MNKNGHWTTCWKCKVEYYIPPALYTAARASHKISIYCPYGHSGVFHEGPTEEDRLRQERDRLKQQTAMLNDHLRIERENHSATGRQLSAQKGVVTRIKNRVGHGVCPCCSRNFQNLKRHMSNKHPAYAKSDIILEAGT